MILKTTDNRRLAKKWVKCLIEAFELCIKFSAGGQFSASKSASLPSAKTLVAIRPQTKKRQELTLTKSNNSMLPKQLKSIKDHLTNLPKLDGKQKQLLHELTFVEKKLPFEGYLYQEKIFESFAVASSTCPNCGKRM